LEKERRLRVFETKVLSTIFGPHRDEVTADWRRLHNEKLNDLYISPNIIRMIKSRRMRRAGNVAFKVTSQMHTGFWWHDLRERDNLEDPDLDWMVI
jgi:hypothetical protein